MIAVIQICSSANVKVNNNIIGKIDKGLVVFLGIHREDSRYDADYLVKKILSLRIYNDNNEKMNLSLKDIKGSILVISQFTLCGNTKKGRRPSFINAAHSDKGKELYKYFISLLINKNISVQSGEFGANMDVQLVNQGPVTFILDSMDNSN